MNHQAVNILRNMQHLDLFAGVGGFSLAARWMGWKTVAWVEINPFCQKVLRKNFPEAKGYNDVKTFNPITHGYNNTIDILTGGDPCQPHSVAGLGKGTKDDRYLWPEMLRIAYELNVPWIVNENVSGSISNGVLDLKINDLESVGYTCQAYCIPAESVGALHQRERVWLVAHNANFYRDNQIAGKIFRSEEEKLSLERQQHKIHQPWEPVDLWITNTYTNGERRKEYNPSSFSENESERLSGYFGFGPSPHGNIPRDILESGIIRSLNGLPEGMDYADRNKRIKALGNAIVPQVAYEIFKAIEKVHHG